MKINGYLISNVFHTLNGYTILVTKSDSTQEEHVKGLYREAKALRKELIAAARAAKN